MDDEVSAQHTNNPTAGDLSSRQIWPIGKIKTYLEKRRAKEKEENASDRAARSTARATWAIAFLTIATIGVGISQYIIFGGQLDVMKRQTAMMESDGRPWVSTSFVGYPPDAAQLGFKNFGRFPAFHVAIKAFSWQPTSYAPLPILPTSRCTIDCKVSDIELATEVPFQFVLARQGGDTTVWIIGRADYEDAQGRPHKTGVCFVHSPDTHDVRDCPVANSNYAD